MVDIDSDNLEFESFEVLALSEKMNSIHYIVEVVLEVTSILGYLH